MRATWLTDVHLNFLWPLALRAFFDRIKAEHPYVVLITGDIAEAHSVEQLLDQLAAYVGAPIYFVLGEIPTGEIRPRFVFRLPLSGFGRICLLLGHARTSQLF